MYITKYTKIIDINYNNFQISFILKKYLSTTILFVFKIANKIYNLYLQIRIKHSLKLSLYGFLNRL